jgi:hypothetical protein
MNKKSNDTWKTAKKAFGKSLKKGEKLKCAEG